MVVLSEISQASSCFSPIQTQGYNHRYDYDVFISFRGDDTRNSFTDHLYQALKEAGYHTFVDDEDLRSGKQVKQDVESTIKASRASIIVLSENYANSPWCLEELSLILDQKKKGKQFVIPIFYHVDPSDVRKQQGSFGEAITKHKQRMEAKKMESWMKALTEVADLKGKDAKDMKQQGSFGEAMAKHKQRMEKETNEEKRSEFAKKMESWKKALAEVADLKGKLARNRKETELIEEVITSIYGELTVPLSRSSGLPALIGMDHHIQLITSCLTNESCHPGGHIVTLVGIGGAGKTSLAKYIFLKHSDKFHKSSFIEDVNARCTEHFNGLLDLQKQLHRDISKKASPQLNDISTYTSKTEQVLARKMVFLVLDDIGSLNQLDALLGNKGLHPGSQVIITTKDASITERCALFNSQAQPKHTSIFLNGLYEVESLQLLCIHAFKSKDPIKQGYEAVSRDLVKYCKGNPLALEVLGRSLHKHDLSYWKDCIKVLIKKEPHFHLEEALKMSFDSLPFQNDKELFKHIACFFVGIDRDVTETILNACGINTRSGITNLINRCLLRIGHNNMLMMHQLVQEMGRDLVRQESPEKPWKRSRVWCHEESFKVLNEKKGKGNLLGLSLDMRMLDTNKLHGSFQLKTDSLSNMYNLMLLRLDYVQFYADSCFKSFPGGLRWLCMHGFPLRSIPSVSPIQNLVALDMSYSNIEFFDVIYSNLEPSPKRTKQLVGSSSENKRLLGSLKILDLSFCEQLQSLGGFFELPVLERLIVRSCVSLTEVCESLEQCVELVHIDLSYCNKLKRLPISLGKLKKLKTLLLHGYNCRESQVDTSGMNSSHTSNINSQTSSSSSAIMEAIPSDFKFFLSSLPSSLTRLSLADSNFYELSTKDFSSLSMLKELRVDNVSVPYSVRTIPRLKMLSIEGCKNIEHLPHMLRVLSIDSSSLQDCSVRRITFHPKLRSHEFLMVDRKPFLYDIEGMVEIQPMAGVEEKLLHSLGWTNLKFMKEESFKTYARRRGSFGFLNQMYYEFGIFSIIYEGKGMPGWISFSRKGPTISFTIPSSPSKLRGLNFCCVETEPNNFVILPMIHVSNITKNQTWIYHHCIKHVWTKGNFLCFLSHWMFGPNEMEGGDQVTICIVYNDASRLQEQFTVECGVGLVYEEEKEVEEDVLGYYKSWNHIIGGDLTPFQLKTGEYLLYNAEFTQEHLDFPSISDEASYKGSCRSHK